MKRKILIYFISSFFIFFAASMVLFDFNKSNNKKKKITLAEVAHTIFYAPQYVAIEKGYFLEEGINLELILTPGADKVMSSLLSGDADIGFSGSEATIYVYNEKSDNNIMSFAQLTQKDGTFIVSRKKYENFSLNNLKGKYIIGGRINGMPEMVLEYSLKKNGINPKKDLYIDTTIAFPAMSGAFIGGIGDFVTLFEPNASELEKKKLGYVVASVGELSGNIPYTSYSAKSNFIKNNKETIIRFKKAISKGLNFVNTHNSLEIAKIILPQFPNTNLKELANSIQKYKDIDAWPTSINFSEDSFNLMQDIMIKYGAINKKVPFGKLIYDE